VEILIIDGGPRRGGSTSTILKSMQNTLEEYHTIKYVEIYSKNIRPCIGCLHCRPDKACVLKKDDAHIIAEQFKSADLFIIGTPTYWGNMTGQLKILFDRCVPTFEYIEGIKITKMLKGKSAILVTTSAAPYPINMLMNQSRGAIKSLETIMRSGGVKIVKVFNISRSNTFESRKSIILGKIDKYMRRNLTTAST